MLLYNSNINKEAIIIIFSTLMILFTLLIFNYYLYKKIYNNKNLFLLSITFIIIYYLISILIYNNNIYNNYEYGILYGDILQNHFCDEYRYFVDSDILLNHFKSGDFSAWITKSLPSYEFIDPQGHPGFGNYNIFVIILAILKLIGFTNTLQIITLKLIVYIPTVIILYKLSKLYLSEKYSLLSVAIFSCLPGYVLTNTLLMRDNIIVLLSLILIYYIISNKINIYLFVPSIVLLFFFRSYLVAILIVSFAFCYKNSKKILSKFDIIYIIIILLSIQFFSTTNFNNEQMRILQERFALLFGSGIMSIIKVCINSVVHIIYDPPYISFLTSEIIYLSIFSLGNILGTVISFLSIIKYIYLIIINKYNNYIYLLKFTFYFTAITAILVLSKDGYIINRIALMWLPLFIIILLIPINNFNNKKNVN